MLDAHERAKIVQTARELRYELQQCVETDPLIACGPEPCVLVAALSRACSTTGIQLELYITAIATDPELARLDDESILSSVTDAPDPGPYDCLSGRDPPDSWLRAHDEREETVSALSISSGAPDSSR